VELCARAQTRPAADRAMAELNGALLHELELKIGWGKAVQLPLAPLYSASNMAAGGARAGVAIAPPGAEAAPPWADPHAAEPASSGARPRRGSVLHEEGGGSDRCLVLKPAERLTTRCGAAALACELGACQSRVYLQSEGWSQGPNVTALTPTIECWPRGARGRRPRAAPRSGPGRAAAARAQAPMSSSSRLATAARAS